MVRIPEFYFTQDLLPVMVFSINFPASIFRFSVYAVNISFYMSCFVQILYSLLMPAGQLFRERISDFQVCGLLNFVCSCISTEIE